MTAIGTLRTIQTPLLETAYFTSGPSSGLPVVLLHGWPDSAITWNAMASSLAEAGYRVIAPYLRGCGPTRFLSADTPRSGQLAALGQDVIDLVDALTLERFVLVGHDWGARAAAIATTELQSSGRASHLVMISVGYGTNDPSQSLPLRQVHNYWYHWYMALPKGAALVRDDRLTLTRYLWDSWGAPGWQLSDAAFVETAEAFENTDWAEVVINSYRHRWGFAEGDPRYDALERRLSPAPVVTVPTLILHGEADRCNDPSSSEGKERWFTNAYRRTILPGVGHFPQREAPAATAAALLSWLGGR